MAKLTSGERNSLSSKTFVFPESRKFPIPDKSHAGGAVQAKVDAAVKRKFNL